MFSQIFGKLISVINQVMTRSISFVCLFFKKVKSSDYQQKARIMNISKNLNKKQFESNIKEEVGFGDDQIYFW